MIIEGEAERKIVKETTFVIYNSGYSGSYQEFKRNTNNREDRRAATDQPAVIQSCQSQRKFRREGSGGREF